MRIDGLCVLGVDREYDLEAGGLLDEMAQNQVDMAVISPVDRYLAVNNQIGNNFVLDIAARHPDCFLPACSANPWYGQAAVEEMRRALQLGARIIVLNPFVQGFQANDELVWPLLAEAERQQAPVYIHTGMSGNSTPWQITDLAERFPAVDFIMGHSGSTDFWNDTNDAARAASNIYLDTSFARPFYLPMRLEVVGNRRIIMSSFAPLNNFTVEWGETEKILSPEDAQHILGENLFRLLNKGRGK